jgi:hypothetical protein
MRAQGVDAPDDFMVGRPLNAPLPERGIFDAEAP